MLSELRQLDRDRYLACLLTNDNIRPDIAALYAFNGEVSRIRDLIKEPLPGEIRLQWWREVTADGARGEEAAAHPIASEINRVIDQHNLPRTSFDAFCQAKIFDLYDDPMPDRQTYEGYCGETSSALIQWCTILLDAEQSHNAANAAGHAGIAQSVAGHLALMSLHRQRGQLFLPLDILTAVGLDRECFLTGANHEQCAAAISGFVSFGREHLNKARQELEKLPSSVFPAFLPVSLSARLLDRSEKMGVDCLEKSPIASAWVRQWDLWRARTKGMI